MASVALHNPSSAVQLNVEMYRYLGLIASDEGLMTKAVKYVQKLAEKKSEIDET